MWSGFFSHKEPIISKRRLELVGVSHSAVSASGLQRADVASASDYRTRCLRLMVEIFHLGSDVIPAEKRGCASSGFAHGSREVEVCG